jgi:hypothetical protein
VLLYRPKCIFFFSFRNVLGVSRAKIFVCMTGVKGIFGPYRVRALGFASGSNLTPRAKNAYFTPLILWRTINLGRPVIDLTSKCEAGIMFN